MTPAAGRVVSVILAAGRGTRMGAGAPPKVAHPVLGEPAIVRAIQTYHRCGIAAHVVVVGADGARVMDALDGAPGEILFCRQREPLGTGDAAAHAARRLEAAGFDGDVLVAAGDKVVQPEAIRKLADRFRASGCALAFLVGETEDNPGAGRVVLDPEGCARRIVEVPEIRRTELLQSLRRMCAERALPASEATDLALAAFGTASKASAALGALWEAIRAGRALTKDALAASTAGSDHLLRGLTPQALASARWANLSIYLFRARALYESVRALPSANAQREVYLTDAVEALAELGERAEAVPVDSAWHVMGFNTREELAAIEERLRVALAPPSLAIEPPRALRPVSAWLRAFERDDDAVRSLLAGIYGPGSPSAEARRRSLTEMLAEHLRRFGDAEAVVARAPGRVNLMGRHVDHQGGRCNLIAIERDTVVVASRAPDGQVAMRNLEGRSFPERAFPLDELLEGDASDWRAFVDGPAVAHRVEAARGDWSQYVRAPLARLLAALPGRAFGGLRLTITGSIPVAAGLSSSSALVVAVAEAACALWGVEIEAERFAEMCGEAEWYVGTRGGAGDHAAMKLSRLGCVTPVGFYPMEAGRPVPLPPDVVVVVANSREMARKTAGARDTFNQRVACYRIARALLRAARPELAARLLHLRDANADTLGVPLADVYRMLLTLPERMPRADAAVALGPDAEAVLSTHAAETGDYPVRGVALFGLAECERGRRTEWLLREGRVREFGRWMTVSHDGDRVVRWDDGLGSRVHAEDVSDAALEALARAAEAGQPDADLALRPGAYACSIPPIDRMVDAALRVEGVLGAQIAGAGLGGCMVALVRRGSVEDLHRALERRYYEPREMEPDTLVCAPVAGSGVLRL
ncbi:MAG TPA: galactokinase family protein [Chthonomonadales bacterium]|nr:galactokinase family protein [Chthonomonadales bacterium]